MFRRRHVIELGTTTAKSSKMSGLRNYESAVAYVRMHKPPNADLRCLIFFYLNDAVISQFFFEMVTSASIVLRWHRGLRLNGGPNSSPSVVAACACLGAGRGDVHNMPNEIRPVTPGGSAKISSYVGSPCVGCAMAHHSGWRPCLTTRIPRANNPRVNSLAAPSNVGANHGRLQRC